MPSPIENALAFLADTPAVLLGIVVALVLLHFLAAAHVVRALSPPCPRCQGARSEGEIICASCRAESDAHPLRQLRIDLRQKDLT